MPACQTERKWIVTLKRSEGDDWPDIKRQFTRSSVFRPDTVIVTISRREGAEPRIEEVSAAGPRVLKAGLSAIDRYSEQWTRGQRPEWWLADLAAEVLERIEAEEG